MKLVKNTAAVFCLIVAASFFQSCTKKLENKTPEGTLESYVSLAFSAKSQNDRKSLIAMTTGDASAHLQKMTEEEFTKQFIEAKLQLISLKVKDIRQDKEGDVSLIYELSFKDNRPGSSPTVNTNKKVAYLSKAEDGTWKIRATQNVKTFIEKKEDLVITPETTPEAGSPATSEKPAAKK